MKIIKLIMLLLSTSAFCAQDGTGNEPKNTEPSQSTDYCIVSAKAQDGTGNNKAEHSVGQLDAYMNYLKCISSTQAQDGTGN